MSEFPPAYPVYACEMTNPDPKFHYPSWAPDNAGIAFGSSKGIEVTRFTAFGPRACAAPEDLILTPTGTEPDWGPADPPAAAYTPAVTPPPPATGTPAPPARQNAAPKAAITLTKTTAKALRKGLAVKVTVPGAGKVKLTAVAKGRTVATGTATARQAGAVTVKLGKVRNPGKTLTLKLTFNKVTTSYAVKVR